MGHELHAKLEEAAEKAMALINHAGKYLEDAEKEQNSMSVDYSKDASKAPYERKKRQIEAVPQTDSEAAKGSMEELIRLFESNADLLFSGRKKRSIDSLKLFGDLDVQAEAVKADGKKEAAAASETEEAKTDSPRTTPAAGDALTPEYLDKMIDVMNKLNDNFGKSIFASSWY